MTGAGAMVEQRGTGAGSVGASGVGPARVGGETRDSREMIPGGKEKENEKEKKPGRIRQMMASLGLTRKKKEAGEEGREEGYFGLVVYASTRCCKAVPGNSK